MSVKHPIDVDDAVTGLGLLAGTANVIMQLSQPGVGHGVVESPVESGKATVHPVKRARTTFTYLAVSIWGSDEERKAYRSAVNGPHRQVRSNADSPVEYNAFDPELQLWVAACLYRGLEDVHNALYPDSEFRGENGIYESSHTMGTTLQVRRDMWPGDRDAFERYWEEQLETMSIDDTVRHYLTKLTDLSFLPWVVRETLRRPHRFFTVGFLPERFRSEMGFEWSETDQWCFDQVMKVLGTYNQVAPAPLRKFPFNAVLADFRRRRPKGMDLV